MFDQAIWGTLHGEFLLNSSQFDRPVNWLGFHFNPVLLAFVPLYALAPRPEWLILAQALAISLSAWPIYRLAGHVFGSERIGLFWALAYLFNPFLLNGAAWDFHPVALAVPFIALGMLAVTTGNRRQLLLACLPLLLIQEHYGLAVAGFGLLWGIRQRAWRTGLLLAALGLAHLVLVLGVVMPALSPTGAHVMLSHGQGQMSRYAWLGGSVGEVLLTLLTGPVGVLRRVFMAWDVWLYLGLLLAPLLFLPLAGLAFLLPGMADLAANLLSGNPMPRHVLGYHSLSLVPVIVAAAIHGLDRISSRLQRLSVQGVTMLVLAAGLLVGALHAPFPLPRAYNAWMPVRHALHPDPDLAAVRAAVARHDSVSVQSNLGPHFSQRSDVYRFPDGAGEVDSIVLRLESPTGRIQPHDPDLLFTLAHHLQMRPEDYLARVACLLDDPRYGVVLWREPWLVLGRRSGDGLHRPHIDIGQALERAGRAWGVNPQAVGQPPVCVDS